MGETLREGADLDIESELNLIKEIRMDMETNNSSEKVEKRTMKELGLKRSGHNQLHICLTYC
jgi:fatty acyl-CoA reductase